MDTWVTWDHHFMVYGWDIQNEKVKFAIQYSLNSG